MLKRSKFINILFLLQIVVILCTARYISDVAQNYEEIIFKMKEQVKNFTTYTYKNCSDQVMYVLNNNSLEITNTKEYLREMHSGKEKVLAESGLGFFPQMIKECEDDFEKDSKDLSKTIADGEDVCLIFISNVFTLVENPELYRNISDLVAEIESIKVNCTNTTYISEAEDCFNREIYTNTQPRIREVRKEMQWFLQAVDRKVKQMTDTLHRCYTTIRNEVLNKKVRRGIRNFQRCVLKKNMHQDG